MKNKRIYFAKDIEKILKIQRKTLYYWETTHKIPESKRTIMGNYRYWLEADIDKIKKILKGGQK